MAAGKSTKTAIERLRAMCLALPEAEEKPFGEKVVKEFDAAD